MLRAGGMDEQFPTPAVCVVEMFVWIRFVLAFFPELHLDLLLDGRVGTTRTRRVDPAGLPDLL